MTKLKQRKLLSSLLAAVMVAASSLLVVGASDVQIRNGAGAGPKETYSEQLARIKKTGSAQQIQEAEAKIRFAEQASISPLIEERLIVYKLLTGVPHILQEQSNWCGPATLKQTLHYFNGTAPEQNVLAAEMIRNGITTDTMMCNKLNEYQNQRTYVKADVPSEAALVNLLAEGLKTYEAPVIAIVDTNARPNDFTYTAQHFLNVTGISTAKKSAYLIDPGTNEDGYATRWYETEKLYKIIEAHISEIIY